MSCVWSVDLGTPLLLTVLSNPLLSLFWMLWVWLLFLCNGFSCFALIFLYSMSNLKFLAFFLVFYCLQSPIFLLYYVKLLTYSIFSYVWEEENVSKNDSASPRRNSCSGRDTNTGWWPQSQGRPMSRLDFRS